MSQTGAVGGGKGGGGKATFFCQDMTTELEFNYFTPGVDIYDTPVTKCRQ